MVARGSVIFKDKQVKHFLNEITQNVNKVEKKAKAVWGILGATAYADVINHFEKERGPKGEWKEWSDLYLMHMIKKGKAGNKILQDKGTLRQGVTIESNRSQITRGVLLVNAVPYARRHDEGTDGMPERKFFWISEKALDKMSEQVLEFLFKGVR